MNVSFGLSTPIIAFLLQLLQLFFALFVKGTRHLSRTINKCKYSVKNINDMIQLERPDWQQSLSLCSI
ncbi:hypothetical protein NQ315_013721 [Exocentrus adspersus]|uniref:ATP synthase F0 subunit 8 n=1 Tax=Exocentrus adspersus TaxID=1586481 RepID=A0AAV8W434_9CUCU|nr:hypothetical protein NQ315_013721 [Exocentrus adspersus]